MTLNEFERVILSLPGEDYVVSLKYKYRSEKEYDFSNEVLVADSWCGSEWLHDWHEGQQDVEVLGFIPVREVNTNVGEWIPYAEDFEEINGFCIYCKCSVCDRDEKFPAKFNTKTEKVEMKKSYNYCPDCGARMKNTEYGEVKRQD